MKKLGEIAKVINGSSSVKDENALWIKSIGEFKALKSIGRNKPENLLQVIPGSSVSKEFLYLILERPLDNFLKESEKALPKLSIAALKSIQIPIPTIEIQDEILASKNVKRKIQKLWLDNGIRSYKDKFSVDMSFDELLKILSQPK